MRINNNGLTGIDILLVEDNPGDVRLTQEALLENKLTNELFVAKNGLEAMDFLRKSGAFSDKPRPDLILLDMNLPLMDGREVLASIKADSTLRSIPVIVLTTSQADEDVRKMYDLHANCFITKPVDMDRFIDVVRAIKEFWIQIVRLPD